MADFANLLLNSLPADIRTSILGTATLIKLPLRFPLDEESKVPVHAYFLTEGMASVVVSLSGGETAEVALIGREGVSGAISLLGPALPPSRSFMQVEGVGYQVPFHLLQSLFLRSGEFQLAVLRFVQHQAMTCSQLVACAQIHMIEARLARWLLMVQDRVGGDEIRVTHEFLAQMLAVQRPTVSTVLGALARKGLIGNFRGRSMIIDRDGLVRAACDCYPVTRRLLKGLYPLELATATGMYAARDGDAPDGRR